MRAALEDAQNRDLPIVTFHPFSANGFDDGYSIFTSVEGESGHTGACTFVERDGDCTRRRTPVNIKINARPAHEDLEMHLGSTKEIQSVVDGFTYLGSWIPFVALPVSVGGSIPTSTYPVEDTDLDNNLFDSGHDHSNSKLSGRYKLFMPGHSVPKSDGSHALSTGIDHLLGYLRVTYDDPTIFNSFNYGTTVRPEKMAQAGSLTCPLSSPSPWSRPQAAS